ASSSEAAIDQLFKRMRSSSSALTQQGSILLGARYPTKDVAVDRHMADGRERQVSGHQRLAVRRQLPQKTDPDAGRLLVEGRDVADIRPQSSVPHPLDYLTQLGTIGLDNEVDRQTVGGPCLARPDDGHQRSSGSNQGSTSPGSGARLRAGRVLGQGAVASPV